MVRCHATLPALSNNLCVARLTNCRSILLSTIANFLSRNCWKACRSPLRIGQSRSDQYKISKTKFVISMIVVTPATESIKASLACW